MSSPIYYKLFIVFFVLVFGCTQAKIFTRCELAEELKRQGFPSGQLRDWVCLIEAESERNTKAVGGPNWDGSHDWGLFQINDRYWCEKGTPGGACYVACDALLSDNIKTASKCALKIFRYHQFNAWVGWVNKCRGELPDLSECKI